MTDREWLVEGDEARAVLAWWGEEQAQDPFAKGSGRHGFWWAGATWNRPGLHFRRRRVLPVSEWILRPGFMWRTR